MSGVRILAPAKINLGLAILGRRNDGYHEIDTIMAMIDLADTISLHHVPGMGLTITGMDDVPLESNLITRAIRDWCRSTGQPADYHVEVQKCIPSAAGLGGGSSDAASILRALQVLHPDYLTAPETFQLASLLGADCPFFLGSTCARAVGIGTTLTPLQAPQGLVVVIVPPATLQSKTATLYAALNQDDYGRRVAMDKIERSLAESGFGTFANSFARPALEAFPELRVAADALTQVTGGWSLSGAGSASFAATPDQRQVVAWIDELRAVLPSSFRILKTRFLHTLPAPEHLA